MVLLANGGEEEAHFIRLEIVLISSQDRCTVCTDHTIGLEIILDKPMDLQGDMGQVETCFRPFEDNVNLGAR